MRTRDRIADLKEKRASTGGPEVPTPLAKPVDSIQAKFERRHVEALQLHLIRQSRPLEIPIETPTKKKKPRKAKPRGRGRE